MKIFMKYKLGATLIGVMTVGVLLLGCGPEQDTVEGADDEIRAINEKETRRLRPIEGHYYGEMVSFAANGKLIPITLDIEIYSAPRPGNSYGEENTKPMLRGFLMKVPDRNKDGEVVSPLPPLSFWQSNFNDKSGELILYNPGDTSGVRGGIQARYYRQAGGAEVVEGTLTTISGTTKFKVSKVVED